MGTPTAIVVLCILPMVLSNPLLQIHKSIDINKRGGGLHREVDFSLGKTGGFLGYQRPQPSRVTYVEQPSTTIIQQRPSVVRDTIVREPTIIQEEQYSVSRPVIQQSSVNYEEIHQGPTVIQEETRPSYSYQGETQVVDEQIIKGQTRVVEEEHEEVVNQVKQTVIEEKVPTIIKTKTPTYIQETVKQKVIREQVPEMVQQQHTEYVTETKPIYVTETKPVTVTENKMVMKNRDRVVSEPGETIITKGQSRVTQEQGAPTYNVLDERIVGQSKQTYGSQQYTIGSQQTYGQQSYRSPIGNSDQGYISSSPISNSDLSSSMTQGQGYISSSPISNSDISSPMTQGQGYQKLEYSQSGQGYSYQGGYTLESSSRQQGDTSDRIIGPRSLENSEEGAINETNTNDDAQADDEANTTNPDEPTISPDPVADAENTNGGGTASAVAVSNDEPNEPPSVDSQNIVDPSNTDSNTIENASDVSAANDINDDIENSLHDTEPEAVNEEASNPVEQASKENNASSAEVESASHNDRPHPSANKPKTAHNRNKKRPKTMQQCLCRVKKN